MQLSSSRALLIPFIILGVVLAGCEQDRTPGLKEELDRLNTELRTTRQKLNAAEQDFAAAKDAANWATNSATEAAKKQAEDKDQVVAQKDAQIRALQTELETIKKRDASVFAEASAFQQKGLTSIALSRYQQFVTQFPKSPLVTDANRAIAELTPTATREARARATLIDPKREERDLLKRLEDGFVSVEEIAPLLKRRTVAEVVKLLGPPGKSFRNGTELGFVDKVLDPRTGNKETLVVTFDPERVVSLRVGYQGREIKP